VRDPVLDDRIILVDESQFAMERLQMRFLPTIAAKPVASKKIVPGSGVPTMNSPLVKT
jgi:hypothetical protein